MFRLIKYMIAVAVRNVWRLFSFFMPLNKRQILFDSYMGKQYSCNPKAIYECLLSACLEMNDVKYIWAFNRPDEYKILNENKNTIVCKYRSLKHYYYSFTSGIIVFNFNRTNELPFRKGQVRLQTWHGGGCYKKTGQEIRYYRNIRNWIIRRRGKTDFTQFISSSKFFSENVIRPQFAFYGPILEIGMPRNDCLFDEKVRRNKSNFIRKKYQIDKDFFVVLYAPTYRDFPGRNYIGLDYAAVKRAVKQRFSKDPVILYRGHYLKEQACYKEFDVDVSDHGDMQDLLCSADMLISDYSSSIWDYSFTYRPCFLFTPDLKEYETYRGLDRDIYLWGFPVCETTEELVHKISEFDPDAHRTSMELHHKDLGSFENGMASKQIAILLKEYMDS